MFFLFDVISLHLNPAHSFVNIRSACDLPSESRSHLCKHKECLRSFFLHSGFLSNTSVRVCTAFLSESCLLLIQSNAVTFSSLWYVDLMPFGNIPIFIVFLYTIIPGILYSVAWASLAIIRITVGDQTI